MEANHKSLKLREWQVLESDQSGIRAIRLWCGEWRETTEEYLLEMPDDYFHKLTEQMSEST